jgi:ABC-type lipoprotein export system ATPase subunit
MAIELKNVWKTVGDPAVEVLKDITARIEEAEFVSLVGRSGSGKSTLLYLISSLDNPTRGQILYDGTDLSELNSEDLHALRNQAMGFVFQFHYLLSELTALENVLLPAMKRGKVSNEQRDYARALLSEVGLDGKFDRLPRQLSGGEQQRVAIARALSMKPRFLFADEPTGALDSINGERVMDIFARVNREYGTAIVMVTHDPDFAARASRQIFLSDGRVVDALR